MRFVDAHGGLPPVRRVGAAIWFITVTSVTTACAVPAPGPPQSPAPTATVTVSHTTTTTVARTATSTTTVTATLPAVTVTVPSGAAPGPGPIPPAPGPDEVDPLYGYWSGLGTARIGDSVESVERALGIEFDEPEPQNDAGDCLLAVSPTVRLGLVVADPGGVQAFVVTTEDVPFVSSTEMPVGVGSTVQDVVAAFPNWVGTDSYSSLAGGERIVVTPQELQGRALLMEADADGIIRQYRVGVDDYALQVDFCSTPE